MPPPTAMSVRRMSIDEFSRMLRQWHYPEAFRPASIIPGALTKHDPLILLAEIQQDLHCLARLGVPPPDGRKIPAAVRPDGWP